jgi:predicted alpha-1,2-mannosidase
VRFGCLVAFVTASISSVGAAHTEPDFASYVNPFNGTRAGAGNFGTGGGAGNTFPGPTLPFGMIQWGPDTSPSSINIGGGYSYDDTKIRGFSLTRLSGTGCVNEGDVPFLPTTSSITSSPVQPFSTDFKDSFLASFSHRDEAATPGFYRVGLDPGTPQRIDAQLTATTRVGIGRFTFPPTRTASLLVNATGSRTGNNGGSIRIDPVHTEVSGSTSSGWFCANPNKYKLYFAARFSRPFASFGTWTRQSLAPGSTQAADSIPIDNPFIMAGLREGYTPINDAPTAQTGAYMTFDTTSKHMVEVRVAISFVSVQAARRNLETETKGLDFAAIRSRARAAWNRQLGRIEVAGGSLEDRATFYSMLYHSLVAPNTFNDVDGRYMGMDDRVHSARGYTQYANFSGWDVYRSQMPLLALIAPHQASDFVRSLLADQRESGWLPKWSVANGQTDQQTGDPAAPTIASIWALGAHNFDLRAATAAAIKGATQAGRSPNAGYVERPAVKDYLRFGYVPHEKNADAIGSSLDAYLRTTPVPPPQSLDLVWGSASTTLEYATADFAVARMAAASGDIAACRTFIARSGNWRNIFDNSIGYMRPRYSTGQFVAPYDPNTNDMFSSRGFAEGDGAQYTWMVPQDPKGLFEALGGNKVAVARLDYFFQALNAGSSSAHAFLGNEPNSNAPWLYDWAGQPWKTQQVVRRAILQLFNSSPGGYPGNDDVGQMSAWYVFGALGIYPEIPGTDVFAINSPLFPTATIHLHGGDLSIIAHGAARVAPYIQRLTLNGRNHDVPWLRLADVARGGQLTFDVGATPSVGWGNRASDAPPSFGPTSGTGCV